MAAAHAAEEVAGNAISMHDSIGITQIAGRWRDPHLHRAMREPSKLRRLRPLAAPRCRTRRPGQASRFQKAMKRLFGWQQKLRTARLPCRMQLAVVHLEAPEPER